MSKNRKESYFWTSYSDLMTSMFFVMLVLFVLGMLIAQQSNMKLQKTLVELEDALNNANARKEQLEQILQLETQFEELSRSSALEYIEERKMFVAKDFVGIEIFYPNVDTIKEEYVATVDSVGMQLLQVVKKLHAANPDIDFQLVIEGNAAIPWQKLRAGEYNKDDMKMYELSYRRALALYQRWRAKGIDLRGYNTEVIIAGSGFNGINRDMQKEDNNKRFIIQIIPKVARPDINTN
mgnify:CR=1 FL=1